MLDLGANYGHFAEAITARFGCKCVAVEPSPEPFAAISKSPYISKIQAAVSDASGTMPFHIAVDSVASSLAKDTSVGAKAINVRVLSLGDLVSQLAWQRIDLLKVDIEGAEIQMLAACSDELLGRIAQMTIEFHDFCGLTPTGDVKMILARLRRLGFFSVRMSRVGHQDTWLINRRALRISNSELMMTRHFVRNWFGVKRLAYRTLRISRRLDRATSSTKPG